MQKSMCRKLLGNIPNVNYNTLKLLIPFLHSVRTYLLLWVVEFQQKPVTITSSDKMFTIIVIVNLAVIGLRTILRQALALNNTLTLTLTYALT